MKNNKTTKTSQNPEETTMLSQGIIMTYEEAVAFLNKMETDLKEEAVELEEMEKRLEGRSKRVKYAASEVARLGKLLEEFQEKQQQDE
ncbi:MAG: hypothetical protein NT091_02555 [Candidatus Falkowbacteria bacterium]|nr:hypothetical protein [Candidatus Falkowbacteria bacterium]